MTRTGSIVVFRHGILLNRYLMLPLERRLRRRGFDVRNASYPTTRRTIEEHARDLADELRRIDDERRERGVDGSIDAVTHSMGGLVVRYALTHLEVPRIRRVVQIVPPNRGSVTARTMERFPPYRWLYGRRSGAQLAERPEGIFEACGVPEGVEWGIIAGTGGWRLLPMRLPSPHDGIVSREEARLGEFPLLELPYSHTAILFRRRTAEEVAAFLETGSFRSR